MRDCCLINGRRILERFPFKTEVRIQYTVTHAFFSAVYSLLRPKSLCLWGYLQRQGFLRIQVCLCNRSKPIKRQKKRAPLTQKQRRRMHITLALLFVFQRLKIGCFKTAVLKNACPCYRCSPSFRNELLVLSCRIVLLLGATCFCVYPSRSHPNDEKVP